MITVFTPAYNRAGTLPRLYESLLAQSCMDFEWLIVDDGSVDHTSEVVKGFTGNGKFPVRYVYKENGGKHTAYNHALQEAHGEYFWCVDSDDLLAPSAIEAVLRVAAQLQENEGICSYKTDMGGTLLGGPFPEKVRTAGLLELNNRYGCKGEFALTFSTAFARKYPFPVFEGERFVTESVVYDRMEKEGTLVLLPEITNICEYQKEGYSNNLNNIMKNNPSGYCLYYLQRAALMPSLISRLVCAGKYWCFKWMCGSKQIKRTGTGRLLLICGIPLGLLFRLYYKVVRKF